MLLEGLKLWVAGCLIGCMVFVCMFVKRGRQRQRRRVMINENTIKGAVAVTIKFNYTFSFCSLNNKFLKRKYINPFATTLTKSLLQQFEFNQRWLHGRSNHHPPTPLIQNNNLRKRRSFNWKYFPRIFYFPISSGEEDQWKTNEYRK